MTSKKINVFTRLPQSTKISLVITGFITAASLMLSNSADARRAQNIKNATLTEQEITADHDARVEELVYEAIESKKTIQERLDYIDSMRVVGSDSDRVICHYAREMLLRNRSTIPEQNPDKIDISSKPE